MLNSGWFFDPDYEWGIGSSPIIYKNMVIVQCDIQRNSFLAAFDADTGKEVWRTRARRDSFVVDADDLRGGRQGGARHAGDHVHPRLRSDDGQGALEVLGQLRDRDPDADRRPRLRRHHERLPRRAADFRDQARRDRATSRCRTRRRRATSSRGARTAAAPISRRRSSTATSCTCFRTTACWRPTRSAPANRSTRSAWANGGSFSASPVAADGKIYCSSEDGDVFVIKAGA